MLKLKRLELLANYGDYFGEQSQGLRARLNKSPDDTTYDQDHDTDLGPPQTWLQISRESKGDRRREVRESVRTCCIILGLNTDHTRSLIEKWGERLDKMPNETRSLIERCQWYSLAKQLSRDLKELHNYMLDPDTLKVCKDVVVQLRAQYFEVIIEDDLATWLTTGKAFDLATELAEKLAKEAN